MSGPVIELAGVSKRFGDFTAVDDLSLTVVEGEIFGLLGPNGSGKTTTINMVSGLSRPSSGAVTVLGRDVTREPREVRRRLGTVPQETALYEELSAEANLRFHGDLFDVPRDQLEQRVTALLDLAGLTDRRRSRVSTFSGGMRRRLALARALLHEPVLLYLDEPTLGVDIQSRRALWDRILELRDSGKTVLLTTNYLDEANVLCDRIAIIDRGRLVALDTPANLKRRYGDTMIDLVTEPPASPALCAELRALPGVTAVDQTNGVLRVTLEGGRGSAGQVVAAVSQAVELKGINQREPNLDEVFLSLTGRDLRE
jgi:daunorubicin resistance ABC transporter ATP-binding subunit